MVRLACGRHLHRTRGPTIKLVERSHGLIKDRPRPTRGLQHFGTGQELLERGETAQAVWRVEVYSREPLESQAWQVTTAFTWPATALGRVA